MDHHHKANDMTPSSYVLASEKAGEEILAAIAADRPARREETPAATLVYFDTFDWRVHRDGGVLAAERLGRTTKLRWTSIDGAPRRRLLLAGDVPGFASDFPPGPFRDALAPVTDIRRLLPMAEVERRAQTLHILDAEGKTVARLHLAVDRVRPPADSVAAGPLDEPTDLPTDVPEELPPTLRLEPLRGYDDVHAALRRRLEDDLGLVCADGSELAAVLEPLARAPRDNASKPRFDLDPKTRADAATVAVLRRLFEAILANEEGLCRDLDSEFLHDFRVAVRRTRSALSQIKKVLPQDVVDHFKGEFKWLGDATGTLRDLDVYLLKIDAYEASLPNEIRADLEPLRAFLVAHQKAEHRRLVRSLDTKRYGKLKNDWRTFLEGSVLSEEKNAGRPILEVASERIFKSFRRVMTKGGAIGEETPAEAIHDLRIDCKKLRYLLEFFKSLYEASEVEPRIKALKKLQDNLGDFNDLEVQRHALRDFARQMEAEGKAPALTLLAMGELVADLRRLQDAERARFHERFDTFAEPSNRKAFERLFGRS